MESYEIKITGDVQKIIPVVNSLLEKEKRRLQRKGVHFEITRRYNHDEPVEKQEVKDIQSDYL
jgi:hypothetical protein